VGKCGTVGVECIYIAYIYIEREKRERERERERGENCEQQPSENILD
jgi:hypothetical protein